ncbi:MAG: hypothetical protein KQJ78_11575 [Deltaproteobacteria bacterium]|nr:hypothetical protein [Deltaproteobacteria bacterium]
MPPDANSPPPPACLGELDKVFPVAPHGLREVSAGCWDCASRVPCLQKAVAEGRQSGQPALGPGGPRPLYPPPPRPERPAAPPTPSTPPAGETPRPTVREAAAGLSGFMQRWSRLKAASQKEKK